MMRDEIPPGIARIKELSQALSSLMDNPQPGLTSWRLILSQTLEELASFCGTEVAVYAAAQRKRRTDLERDKLPGKSLQDRL